MEDFDPSALLETVNEGDLNTNFTPVPEGEYRARIKDGSLTVKGITSTKTGEKYTVAEMYFIIDDQAVIEATGLKEPTVRASVFLTIDPVTKTLVTKDADPNANIDLGRLKEALGFADGKPWKLKDFEGRSCWVKVKQEADANDITKAFSRITAYYKERKSQPESASRRRVA
jgi:hypothetical protein